MRAPSTRHALIGIALALAVGAAVLALRQHESGGWPGGDAYSLVVKPYPSLLKQIPHMEERGWRDALASGVLPRWVSGGVVSGGGAFSNTCCPT